MNEQPTEPIGLSDPIQEICRRLNVDYGHVAELILRPTDAQVTVRQFKTNADGRMYVDPETQDAADEILTFQIRS